MWLALGKGARLASFPCLGFVQAVKLGAKFHTLTFPSLKFVRAVKLRVEAPRHGSNIISDTIFEQGENS